MALVQNLEGGDQLASKKGGTPAVIGEGGQRRHHGVPALKTAIISLDPPKGDDETRLDLIVIGDLPQERPVLPEQRPATVDPGFRQDVLIVLLKGQPAFGLAAIEVDHLGHGFQLIQRRGDRRWRNPGGRRLGSQV
jgi:hypothetical protein